MLQGGRDDPWGRYPKLVQSGLWIGRDPSCSASCGIVREDHVRRPSLALIHPYRRLQATHYKLSVSECEIVLVTHGITGTKSCSVISIRKSLLQCHKQ